MAAKTIRAITPLSSESARRASLGASVGGIISSMDDPPDAEQIKRMSRRDHKVYENRIRRVAARQLLQVKRSRRRDPRAYDFGFYQLVDYDGNVVASGKLSEIHEWLVS